MHAIASMFHIVFYGVNENLKANVTSKSIYQHKTIINNWTGKHWVNMAKLVFRRKETNSFIPYIWVK